MLATEPATISILYRWGQLTGDFTDARAASQQLLQLPGQLAPLLRGSGLGGEFPIEIGALDIVPERQELIDLIEAQPEKAESHRRALKTLASQLAVEYFAGRSSAPTVRWPPQPAANMEKGA